jgi:Putative transposase/Transposase zinc-binding domain
VHDTSPTLGDVIRRFGAALQARHGETMTAAQKAVLSALGRCHTAALGGHLYRCDRCGAEHAAYNSCRSRHCPSCLGHKSARWLEARADELLPVPYFHVVFTVPQQIAAVAWANKKLVYEILFRAAAQTLLQISRDPRHLGAHIGFLAILHTWTQTLLHHPHIHCVVPGGGLSPDRRRWIGCRDNFFLPVKVLSRLFRGKFLSLLDAAAKRGTLRFAGSTAALADARAWTALLRQMYRKNWVVYAKPPFGSPEQVLKYLARYTHRVAISNRRIVSLTDEHVTFRYRDRTRGNAIREMKLDGLEFLRRFLLHVLPKSFVRIRHFGLLANRVRNTNLAVCRSLLGTTSAAPRDPTQTRDNDQPAICPVCHTGRLRWIAMVAPVVPFQLHREPLPPPDTS